MSNKDKLITSALKNIEKGQIQKAISDYQELLKLEPKNDQFRQKLAELMSRANMPTEAIGHFEVLARGWSERGFYLKAIALYKQIQKLDATKIDVYFQLADLNKKQGLSGNAMAEYRSLLELCEKKKSSSDTAIVLQKMVELEPENLNLHTRSLQHLLKDYQYDKFVESILFAVDAFLKIGDTEKTQKLFDIFVTKLPDDSKLLLDLSKKLMGKNAFNEAVRVLNLLIKSAPDDPSLLELLADCHKSIGDLVSERLTLGHLVKIEGNAGRCERLIRVCLSEGDAQRTLHELEAHKNILAQAGHKSVLIDLYRELDKMLPGNAKIKAALQFLGVVDATITSSTPIHPPIAKESVPEPASIRQPVPGSSTISAVSVTPEIKPTLPPEAVPLSSSPAPTVTSTPVSDSSLIDLSEETDLESLLGGFSSETIEEYQIKNSVEFTEDVELDLSTSSEEESLAVSLLSEGPSEDFEIELDLTDLSPANIELEPSSSSVNVDPVETDIEIVDDLVELEEESELDLELESGLVFDAGLDAALELDALDELEELEAVEEEDAVAFPSEVAISPAHTAGVGKTGLQSTEDNNLLMDLQALEDMSLDLTDEMFHSDFVDETKSEGGQDFLPGERTVELALDRSTVLVVESESIDIDSQYHDYADSQALDIASLPVIATVAPSRSFTNEVSDFSDFDAEFTADAENISFDSGLQNSSNTSFGEEVSASHETTLSESVNGFWLPSSLPPEFVEEFPFEETVSDFHAELEEIDFYLKQELFDQAERVCQNILTIVPDHPVASLRLAELVQLRQAKAVTAEIPEDDFFDLASELLDDGALQATEGLSSLEDADRFRFDSVFSEFKKGIESQIDSEDSESHYNLGIAYKEMGLFDDAVSEFVKVMRGNPARLVDCLSLVGICNAEKGDFDQAETVFRTAISRPELSEIDRMGMQYELGLIYEVWEKPLEALTCFEAVSTIDIFYRNVGDKVDALRAAGISSIPSSASPVVPVPGGKSRVSFV